MTVNRLEDKSRPKHSSKLLPAALVVMILMSLLFVEFFLRAAGGILIVADPLEESDAAYVLSGGGIERLEEAALLYKNKDVNQVILTDTGITLPEYGDYTKIMRFEATRLGIPPGAILITEQVVTSTWEEAVAAKKTFKSRGIASAVIVTEPYHSLRTKLIFNRIFRGSDIIITIHPVRGHWYQSTNWWQTLAGWELTINEYFKLLAFFLGFRSG